MDKEAYFQSVRKDYQEFILDKVKVNPAYFGDLETRTAALMGLQPLFFNPCDFKEGFYEARQCLECSRKQSAQSHAPQ